MYPHIQVAKRNAEENNQETNINGYHTGVGTDYEQ